jgi:hypothetical protein
MPKLQLSPAAIRDGLKLMGPGFRWAWCGASK